MSTTSQIDVIERQKNVSFLRIYIAHVTVHFREDNSQNCDTLNLNIENFQETVKNKKLPLNRQLGNNINFDKEYESIYPIKNPYN
jgi:hypothetical protein